MFALGDFIDACVNMQLLVKYDSMKGKNQKMENQHQQKEICEKKKKD